MSTNTGCTKFNQDPAFHYQTLINQVIRTHFEIAGWPKKQVADVDLAEVHLIELNLIQIQSLLPQPSGGPVVPQR